MKAEFDFNKVGKQTPYKVPPDFFDTITEDTLSKATVCTSDSDNKVWRWTSIAATILIVLVTGYFTYNLNSDNEKPVAQTELKQNQPVVEPDLISAKAPAATEQTNTAEPKPLIKQEIKTSPKGREQVAHVKKAESLEDILAGVTDEELLELAALAETELYVYEETLSYE
jgi:hypothetical protein